MPEDNTEDKLAQYLQTVDRGKASGEKGEVPGRVEGVFAELNLPWRSGPNDTWKIESDVGEISLGLDEDHKVLSVWQLIAPIDRKLKKNADFLRQLLGINAATRGACIAVDEVGDEEWTMIIGRLSARTLDPEELAMMMEDVFATSRLFDPPSG